MMPLEQPLTRAVMGLHPAVTCRSNNNNLNQFDQQRRPSTVTKVAQRSRHNKFAEHHVLLPALPFVASRLLFPRGRLQEYFRQSLHSRLWLFLGIHDPARSCLQGSDVLFATTMEGPDLAGSSKSLGCMSTGT